MRREYRQMPRADVTLREAWPEELAALEGLYTKAWSEFAGAVGPEAWERMRSGFGGIPQRAEYSEVIVAERDGQTAGAVLYTGPGVRPADPPGPLGLVPREWAYVGIIAVLPEHRGHGVGRLLVEACVDRARRDGAPSIGLGTRPVMEAARRLYERVGFRRRPDLEGGRDEYEVYEFLLVDRL
jgi:ribosomal protein S18 acetylase RimI-like enzyme